MGEGATHLLRRAQSARIADRHAAAPFGRRRGPAYGAGAARVIRLRWLPRLARLVGIALALLAGDLGDDHGTWQAIRSHRDAVGAHREGGHHHGLVRDDIGGVARVIRGNVRERLRAEETASMCTGGRRRLAEAAGTGSRKRCLGRAQTGWGARGLSFAAGCALTFGLESRSVLISDVWFSMILQRSATSSFVGGSAAIPGSGSGSRTAGGGGACEAPGSLAPRCFCMAVA